MKSNLIFFRIVWTILCIIAIVFFAMISFMHYNWYPNTQTGSMNVIIITACLAAILSRIFKNRIILLLYIIISDITLIIVSNRGIINGHFWMELCELIQTPISILFLIAWIILISDWYMRFKRLQLKKNYDI
ncbi:MAG: hypothetical protein K0R51_454 [Cytophagaceae bacterium]|jgi:hypothetical protein|nr:hypothetical protein [Cytophagaceae bacterium]